MAIMGSAAGASGVVVIVQAPWGEGDAGWCSNFSHYHVPTACMDSLGGQKRPQRTLRYKEEGCLHGPAGLGGSLPGQGRLGELGCPICRADRSSDRHDPRTYGPLAAPECHLIGG